MKRAIKCLLVSSLLGVALTSVPLLQAADSKAKAEDKAARGTKATTEEGKAKRNWYPFHGIVGSIDKQANTISLKKKQGARVLKLDAKSKIEVNGKPATIGSVKPGDYAHGTLHKDSAGKEVITAAKFDKEQPKKDKNATRKETQKAPASESKG